MSQELQTVEEIKSLDFTIDLTPEDKNKILSIKENTNLSDSTNIIKYGVEAQKNITNFTDKMLSKVKLKDLGAVGETLQEMIISMEGVDIRKVSSDSALSRIPIIGEMLFTTFKKFMGGFDTVNKKMEALLKILNEHDSSLVADIAMLDEMYKENLNLLRNLELYILAGEDIIKEAHAQIEELKIKAEETKDPAHVQSFKDAKQALERFEKRIYNLKIARHTCIQAAPQIRLAQEGDKMLLEDVQDVIHNTIPLWKRQFMMAISAYQQQKSLRVTKSIKDYTNKQYQETAKTLEDLSIQIAENFQRGILDVNTLENVNEITINTIKKTLEIQKEGKIMRSEAEKSLIQMENELKESLMAIMETS